MWGSDLPLFFPVPLQKRKVAKKSSQTLCCHKCSLQSEGKNEIRTSPFWWGSYVNCFKSMTLCKWLTQHPLMWILGHRLHSLNSNLKCTAAEHSCVSQHLSGKKVKHFIWCHGEECEPLLIGKGMQKSMKTKLRMVVGAGHGTSLQFRWEIFLPSTLVCAVAGKVLLVNTNIRKTSCSRL